MKRHFLSSLALAAALALSLVIPSFAANITIDGAASGFNAYKLLNLTTSLKTPGCHADGEHNKNCYNFAYTVNEKYKTILQGVVQGGGGAPTDREIVKYISDLTEADAIRTFADDVYGRLGSTTADKHTDSKVFDGVDQGYYLIAEAAAGTDPDSISLVMLDTAGHQNIEIKTKEGVPTLKKEVKESNTEGTGDWGSSMDADVGDEVEFRLTGKMPDNIDNYEKYKYVFHDDMGDALAFINGSVSITIDNVPVDASQYTVSYKISDDCDVKISFDDIKSAASVNKDSSVVVTYKAKLLNTVQKSVGNSAKIEFTKNPYDIDGGGTSFTIPSNGGETEVYSYKVIVNKTDGDNKSLPGAEFKIQKKNASGEYEDYANGSPAKNEDGTRFTFNGLDAGDYKLIELTTPDGYNTADPVEFTITATHDKDELKTLSAGDDFTANTADGTLTTIVVNSTGAILPTTGGSGTYLLYAIGTAIVVFGLIFLVIRGKKEPKEK